MDENSNDLGEQFRALYEAVESLRSFEGLTKDSSLNDLMQMGMANDPDGEKERTKDITLSDIMGIGKTDNDSQSSDKQTSACHAEEVTGKVIDAADIEKKKQRSGQEISDEYQDMPLMELFNSLEDPIPPEQK